MTKKKEVEKNTKPQQIFEIRKIYTKDISCESPNTPDIFRKNWEPETNLKIVTGSKRLDKDAPAYEVVVKLTVETKIKDEVAYIAEVEQAGVFIIEGFEEEVKNHIAGATAPNILFPYILESMTSLSQKAGFPPVVLNLVDFNALYQDQLRQKQESKK